VGLVLLVAACAKAGPNGNGGGGGMVDANNVLGGQDAMRSGFVDAPPGTPDAAPPPIDAPAPPPIDAPPNAVTMTLTETTNNTVAAGDTIACVATEDDENVGTRPNNYYRVFDLATAGITSTFTVSSVTFAVEDCDSSTGTSGCPNISVRVGTYSTTPPTNAGGTLVTGDLDVLASTTTNVPEIDEAGGDPPQDVTADLTASIPGSSQLLLEVDAPEGSGVFNFFIGASTGGQNALGFISSSVCDPPGTTPVDIQSLATAPNNKIAVIMSVTGSYIP
jgi:hypothetical protein